jgi:hypothetical protein
MLYVETISIHVKKKSLEKVVTIRSQRQVRSKAVYWRSVIIVLEGWRCVVPWLKQWTAVEINGVWMEASIVWKYGGPHSAHWRHPCKCTRKS